MPRSEIEQWLADQVGRAHFFVMLWRLIWVWAKSGGK
jgi:low affinity Fe/Cu permease